jgi:hypothetical protein
MKRLLGLIFLLLAGFYVVWPGFAAYQIKSALEAKDKDGLAGLVDFDSVRQSLRPAIAAKVESSITQAADKAGPAGAGIFGALKGQLMPKIVDNALQQLVTPDNLIKLHAGRATLKDAMDQLVLDQVAKQTPLPVPAGDAGGGGLGDTLGKIFGGLVGGSKTETPAPAPTAPAAPAAEMAGADAPAHKYSLANLKGAGFDGPLALYLKIAKDPSASNADVTARMTFVNGGWRLTGLEPNF